MSRLLVILGHSQTAEKCGFRNADFGMSGDSNPDTEGASLATSASGSARTETAFDPLQEANEDFSLLPGNRAKIPQSQSIVLIVSNQLLG